MCDDHVDDDDEEVEEKWLRNTILASFEIIYAIYISFFFMEERKCSSTSAVDKEVINLWKISECPFTILRENGKILFQFLA